jgi:predicted enzyme related to lactoylglutathione lyase
MIKAINEIGVITLFVEDLPRAKAFYQDVFGWRSSTRTTSRRS